LTRSRGKRHSVESHLQAASKKRHNVESHLQAASKKRHSVVTRKLHKNKNIH
jgi:hypothetical protein